MTDSHPGAKPPAVVLGEKEIPTGHEAQNQDSDNHRRWDSQQTITPAPRDTISSSKEDLEQKGHKSHHGHDSDSPSLSPQEDNNDDDHDPENPPAEEDKIPDGGKTAWLVVLGAWCVSFCSYGWINSIGTFQSYYQSGPLKDYTVSQISWIPSMQIFFMSFLGPPIGHVYDRYGMRWLLSVGSIMHVFGLMMASISSKYYQFMLSQGVCSAIGVAVCFLSAISAVTGWFDKKRGLAFGLLSTGSSLGGVVFPIMLSKLMDTLGYGWAMRISAFMILGLLVVANLTLKTRVPPASKAGKKIQRVLSGPAGAGGSIRSAQGRKRMWKPFKEVPFVLLLAGLFLIPFGLYIPVNYLPVASLGAGMTKDMSQNVVAIYNGASLVGRFSSGFISDKAGRYNIFVLSCFSAGILVLAMWVPVSSSLPNATAVSIAFAAMFGIFSGGYISLMASLVAAISPLNEIGYRNGLTFLFSSVGGLVTNPIGGAIVQAGGGNWAGLKIFAGMFMIAGTAFILATRIYCAGWKVTKVF
ncbi:MFS general substrate transporter [Naviculisporaceae sp. PSN 640]